MDEKWNLSDIETTDVKIITRKAAKRSKITNIFTAEARRYRARSLRGDTKPTCQARSEPIQPAYRLIQVSRV
jgi:hypothetical protein